ncbi:MAG TPA: CHRD domain-containing protein [Bryobacteraceae bacterium]|nr:CHRD domain-containing protein [Bryobacteraceae bacterium]
MKRRLAAAFGAIAVVWTLAAEAQETFKTRLSPVPIDAQLAPVVTGHGSVSAVLAGTKLTVTGTFEGMRSAATAAHLQQSKMTGVRGVVTHELTVSKATSGTVSGAVDLTPPEVEALRKGLLYVLVNSVGAPDGNLWGWLLK